jgi:hypothetical protein
MQSASSVQQRFGFGLVHPATNAMTAISFFMDTLLDLGAARLPIYSRRARLR